MVIFEDLQKLLLYQRLNLGFECHLCKKKFYNRSEYLQHTSSCKSDLKCPKCGKTFGHVRILQLHLQFHNLSESLALQSPEGKTVKSDRENDHLDSTGQEKKDNLGAVDIKTTNLEKTTDVPLTSEKSLGGEPGVSRPTLITVAQNTTAVSNKSIPFKILEADVPKKKSSHRAKEKPKQDKKQVGLTKIKMEDCLRCDACSCIYIDEKDYYKHMRNFHQRDVNNAPIQQKKTKRKCRSCCKQCRGSHCTPIKRPRATQRASNLIFRINMRDNIKNRWTQMVSQQLSGCPIPNSVSTPCEPEPISIKPDPDLNITIKQEPEPDLSYLLSQVEVKIKTEPPDEY